jgi:hypothetical protein
MGLKQDVSTRWNFTYLMLVSVIHHRLAFSYLDMIEPNFDHCPTPLEWEKMESICSFLGSFIMLHVNFLVQNISQPTYTFLLF